MNEATVLTQADCAWCERAKTVLGRLADEEGFSVREIDLGSTDGRRLAERYRVLFAPGIVYADQLVAYGRVSERALRRRLARLAASTPEPG